MTIDPNLLPKNMNWNDPNSIISAQYLEGLAGVTGTNIAGMFDFGATSTSSTNSSSNSSSNNSNSSNSSSSSSSKTTNVIAANGGIDTATLTQSQAYQAIVSGVDQTTGQSNWSPFNY